MALLLFLFVYFEIKFVMCMISKIKYRRMEQAREDCENYELDLYWCFFGPKGRIDWILIFFDYWFSASIINLHAVYLQCFMKPRLEDLVNHFPHGHCTCRPGGWFLLLSGRSWMFFRRSEIERPHNPDALMSPWHAASRINRRALWFAVLITWWLCPIIAIMWCKHSLGDLTRSGLARLHAHAVVQSQCACVPQRQGNIAQ